MAKEIFDAVLTAEEKADHLIQEAQREARELIKTAETDCTENERKMAHEHRAMHQSILEEKRASVQESIQRGREARQSEQDALIAQASGRLNDAAQQIFERVWNDGNR